MADLTPEQQEQEEFEFRARAEEEEAARKQAALSENKPVEGAVKPDLMTNVVGGLKTAYDVGAPIIAEHPVAASYAASYIPGVNKLPVIRDIKAGREAVGNIAQRAANMAQNYAGAAPGPVNPATAPVGTPANPVGAQTARTVPVSGAVAPESVPITRAATQTAAAAAPAEASMISRAGQMASQYAPAMRAGLGMAGRLAGPAGLAYSLYQAAPELHAAGQQLNLGQAQQRMRQAQQAPLTMPTPAPLSAQEANNLLASGDERTINIYGGRQKLMSIANPNALNSGFAQQLNRMGR
jgi:hypothetical protein